MKSPEIDKYRTKRWYNNRGQLHRKDGPAVEYILYNGDKEWWINGKLHREDGPAVEWRNGNKWWYINGKRHREDGPAIELAIGIKWWYYNDEFIGDSRYGFTQEKFERHLRELKIKEYW